MVVKQTGAVYGGDDSIHVETSSAWLVNKLSDAQFMQPFKVRKFIAWNVIRKLIPLANPEVLDVGLVKNNITVTCFYSVMYAMEAPMRALLYSGEHVFAIYMAVVVAMA